MNYSDVTGRIFDIQRFSVHDGPGVRTIVFLKGCLMRCRWCCNPESQEFEIQKMNFPDKEKTVGKDVTAGEIISGVLQDMPYYRRSGGGLTLSGGESLLQPQFAKALLCLAKENSINTAIETTANVDFNVIEELLPYIDYFLMDIKHISSEKHEKFTGKPNGRILENAEKIAKMANSYTVRVPVIPTFNDTKEEIEDIARFAAKIGAEKMHILPYHRLGCDKYAALGRQYLMGDVLPPDDSKMAVLKLAAENCGIKCQIGG